MQLAITDPNGALTMSTREIAGLTGKEHKNVLRDARAMLAELHGEQGVLSFEQTYRDPQNGQTYPELALPKREYLILVTGYSMALRAKIIDRWQELEARARSPQAIAANYSRMELLEMAMAAEKERLQLTHKVAELEPKAVALDRISKATFGSTCIREAAKALDERAKQFFHQLHSWGWIFPQRGGGWSAYSDRLAAGDLELKTTTIERTDGTSKCVHQVLVTPQGLAKLAMKLGKPGPTAPLFQ